MAIINITPDSFSGDGQDAVDAAVSHALKAETDGAAILDLGAESTRPGAIPVSAEEELRRLLPVLAALRARTQLRLSIDTSKAIVAEAALRAGADMINDVWAGMHDPLMFQVVSQAGCPIVLMHNRSQPAAVAPHTVAGAASHAAPAYQNVVDDVIADLSERVDAARAAGIQADRIILDPGIGFGKSVADNLRLVNGLERIKVALPYPVLLGTSRKSFIGQVLGGLPVTERLEGTAATVAIGIARGADILRVHDVRAMTRVARMAAAVVSQQ
jgi:dihydropteroate synthase